MSSGKTYYRLSSKVRKYSTTPLVKVIVDPQGKETEEDVLYSPLKKKEGDAFLEAVAALLNENAIEVVYQTNKI